MADKDKKKENDTPRELEIQILLDLLAVGVFLIIYFVFYSSQPIHIFEVVQTPSVAETAVHKAAPFASAVSAVMAGGAEAALKPAPAAPEQSGISGSLETGEREVLMAKSVDLNSADEVELDKLPGIGPILAKRIVEYRRENGDFTGIQEVKEVEGIGEQTFLKIEDFIVAR